jgi:hypothetical protein
MMFLVEALVKVLLELPPKDHPTIVFCNTLGGCVSLEKWLSSVPEAIDMCGGEYKMAALHGRMDKKVIFLCIL